MCDFFWLSPADQGDLSDVVRAASLQQQPLPPAPPAPTVFCSNGSHHHLPAEEEELPVHGNGGMGLMVGSDAYCRDRALLYHPQHHPEVEEPLIPQIRSNSSFVEREEDDAANAAAVVLLDELGLDMAMAPHHPHAVAAPSIKRRKSQTKKVVCIPAPVAPPPGSGGRPSTSGEVVPCDLWAWRKYGQKPIKGSPYPRGYYRCSSSKGCSARKQVERSRTDPSMLVITYTSDHNHPWPTQRNSLAGSIRPPPAATAVSKAHHHQRHHRHGAGGDVTVADSATAPAGSNTASVHHRQQLLKQEVLDLDMDNLEPARQDTAADRDMGGMIADLDGASGFHSKRQQQQHGTADPDYHLERLPEEEDKQQLLLDRDPFSFSFFDWVGASFGAANEDDGYYS
ncbi:unnamed protein product [Urochloa humidicola]